MRLGSVNKWVCALANFSFSHCFSATKKKKTSLGPALLTVSAVLPELEQGESQTRAFQTQNDLFTPVNTRTFVPNKSESESGVL